VCVTIHGSENVKCAEGNNELTAHKFRCCVCVVRAVSDQHKGMILPKFRLWVCCVTKPQQGRISLKIQGVL
jgi:hypothetical protein